MSEIYSNTSVRVSEGRFKAFSGHSEKTTLRKLYTSLLGAVYTSSVSIYWSVTSTLMNPILLPHLGPVQLIW